MNHLNQHHQHFFYALRASVCWVCDTPQKPMFEKGMKSHVWHHNSWIMFLVLMVKSQFWMVCLIIMFGMSHVGRSTMFPFFASSNSRGASPMPAPRCLGNYEGVELLIQWWSNGWLMISEVGLYPIYWGFSESIRGFPFSTSAKDDGFRPHCSPGSTMGSFVVTCLNLRRGYCTSECGEGKNRFRKPPRLIGIFVTY